jgi:flagellar basal-body rod protein FlgF
MQNALLVGLSKQVVLHREMDVIANNLANMNSNGFKAEGMTFEEYLPRDARPGASPQSKISMVRDSGTTTDFSEGSLQETGGALDLALRGQGYFVVETPKGDRYTRNGSFSLNQKGELVNSQGYRVRGANGPIQFDQNDSNITFGHDGTITAINGNEKQVIERAKLRMVRFDKQETLTREGAGLYSAGTQAPLAITEKTSLVQGSLEKSNVKPIVEMTHMLEVMRSYSSLSTMMSKTDDLRKTAINKLADVTA